MKILVIYDGYTKIGPDKGSIPAALFNLTKAMVQEGHEVTILERKDKGSDGELEQIDGIRFVRLKVRKRAGGGNEVLYRFPFGLIKVVTDGIAWALSANRWLSRQDDDFDIVHVHLPLASTILVFLNRKLRRKMVYTFHGDGYRVNLESRVKVPWYVRLVAPDLILMRRVARVVLLNESLLKGLLESKQLSPGSLTVIGVGIDTDMYRPDVNGAAVQQKYQMAGKATVYFAGVIFPRKGVEYLIRAADILVNQQGRNDLLFLLAGNLTQDPDYVRRMESLIQGFGLEGIVKLLGRVPNEELVQLYVSSDLFVCPSPEEAFPSVVLEAMACGKPVIGTKVGGMLEQIVDGWNGFLVEPEDEGALAEKIGYLLDHSEERQRMGLNSRQRAVEEFDWDRVARRYLETYEQVVNEQR